MDLKLSVKYIISICFVLIFNCPAYSQKKEGHRISIQGDLDKNFELSKYIDTSIIDFIIIDAPFYMLELEKENDFSIVDTLDAMSPISYHLYKKLKLDFHVFGDYQPAYKKLFLESKYDIVPIALLKNEKNRSLDTNQIDSLLSPLVGSITDVQYEYLKFSFFNNSPIENFWQNSDFINNKNILFLSPHSGDKHFDEEYYLLKKTCDYIILVDKKGRRKKLKKISKEFNIPLFKLKKSDSSIPFSQGTLKIEFIFGN